MTKKRLAKKRQISIVLESWLVEKLEEEARKMEMHRSELIREILRRWAEEVGG